MKNKVKIKLILISVIMLGCNAGKQRINLVTENWSVKFRKQYYKDYVLCNCLLMGIGDKEFKNTFYEQDKSFYSPVEAILLDSNLNEILKPLMLKIKKDSLESIETVAEGAAGKQVFRDCLKFYKSKKLDSISNSQMKKWRKIRNLDSLVVGKYLHTNLRHNILKEFT